MATELTKLLKKIEKQTDKAANNPCDVSNMFIDICEYREYIRKQLNLTKKSTVYVFDMEDENYMNSYYETLMQYVGKDISIQLGQSYFDGADGYYDVIVMVITKND